VDYTYLVASLPLLSFGGEPPMTVAEFVVYATPLMAPRDAEGLRKLVAGRFEDVRHPAIQALAARETQLRNAVARARAVRVGQDPGRYTRPHEGWQVAVEEGVAQAMAIGDPLQREQALDQLRWGLIDEIAAAPAFGLQAVYAYALKLSILEEWDRRDHQRGMDVAHRVIEESITGIQL